MRDLQDIGRWEAEKVKQGSRKAILGKVWACVLVILSASQVVEVLGVRVRFRGGVVVGTNDGVDVLVVRDLARDVDDKLLGATDL